VFLTPALQPFDCPLEREQCEIPTYSQVMEQPEVSHF
jgi:hypothetical protein